MVKPNGVLVLVSSNNAGKLAAIGQALKMSGIDPVITGCEVPPFSDTIEPLTDLSLYKTAEGRGKFLTRSQQSAAMAIGIDGRVVFANGNSHFQSAVCIYVKSRGRWRKTVSALSNMHAVVPDHTKHCSLKAGGLPTGTNILAKTVEEALIGVCL